MDNKKLKPIPEVGKSYHFWDDGKTSVSRHYICKVERIVPFEEAKNIILSTPRGENDIYENGKFENVFINMSLEDIWKEEVRQCDWLYEKETDYFIEASCPVYDDNNLWFARTKYGGWFSMNIQSWWQSGALDVDENIFTNIVEFWKNDKYCSEESRKAIVESYYDQKYEKKK